MITNFVSIFLFQLLLLCKTNPFLIADNLYSKKYDSVFWHGNMLVSLSDSFAHIIHLSGHQLV